MEPAVLHIFVILSLLPPVFSKALFVSHPQPNWKTAPGTPFEEVWQGKWQVGQMVNTTSGMVQGTQSTLRPGVSAYLGIPFAQPPKGNLRFEAPQPVQMAAGVIDGTKVGPDCPCNLIPIDNAAQLPSGGTNVLIGVSQHGDVLDEDCLQVNVWTKPQMGEAKKAVLLWIFGGGFSIGNAVNKVYDGSVLADENDVVVVAPNYRTNIFGFSGAPGVTQNVGLLDQRLATEWARDNVEAFGGDPSRITLFGQSAGGASVDFVPYAYPDDPIAHAIIPQSGTANALFASSSSASDVTGNWYNVSTQLGCGGLLQGADTVTCMRTKTVSEILAAMTKISNIAIASGFTPVVDNKTVPSNISDRLSKGDFAKLPTLAGNTNNEAGFFQALWFTYSGVKASQVATLPQWALSFIQVLMDVITPIGFTCTVMTAAKGRASANVPIWKYTYYGGNYTNTYIPYVGSNYHTSELPVLFGTAASVSGQMDSEIEASQERYMRQAWAVFAKDPVNGLESEMGWEQYSNLLPHVVKLAYNNDSEPSTFPDYASEAFCAAVNTAEGVAQKFLAAISPFETLLGPIWNDTIGMFLGTIRIPPVDVSQGGTFTLLLSFLQFFTSALPV